MKEKWIVHHGDQYYPWAEEFDNYEEAKKVWDELLEERLAWFWEGNGSDYFAQVIEEFDPNPVSQTFDESGDKNDSI